mgnify:CR=1 FL=1
MVKIDVADYIGRLRNASKEEEADLYSIKKQLNSLSDSSAAFDDFEKESIKINKDSLSQIEDLGLLLKIKSIASGISRKKAINDKLHSMHFSLNLGKNNSSAMNALFDIFLRDNNTKIENIINELNDFKAKLSEIKKHHSKLLPKSLDNKLEIEDKYDRHLEKLHSIHKRQKSAFISLTKLFLKMAKNHIKKKNASMLRMHLSAKI